MDETQFDALGDVSHCELCGDRFDLEDARAEIVLRVPATADDPAEQDSLVIHAEEFDPAMHEIA